MTCADSVGDQLPGRAVIAGAVKVRLLVIEPMTIHRGVGFRRIEVRSFDQRYLAPVARRLRGNVFPGLPAVAREMDQAGVAAGPDQICRSSGEGAMV